MNNKRNVVLIKINCCKKSDIIFGKEVTLQCLKTHYIGGGHKKSRNLCNLINVYAPPPLIDVTDT